VSLMSHNNHKSGAEVRASGGTHGDVDGRGGENKSGVSPVQRTAAAVVGIVV